MHCCPAPLLCSSLQHQPLQSSSLLLLRLMHEQAGQVLVGQFGVPNDINVEVQGNSIAHKGTLPVAMQVQGHSW